MVHCFVKQNVTITIQHGSLGKLGGRIRPHIARSFTDIGRSVILRGQGCGWQA